MEETTATVKLGSLEKDQEPPGGCSWATAARDLLLPLAFLLVGVVPFTTSFVLFYPDERFYLDASLTMHESGDLLVPRNDDGSPRLIKPLLTYWIMVASYQVFGVHLWSARLPFLLAAVGMPVGAYWLAQILTGKRRVARLTVWIVLANPLFWLSAMRCLPDVLLGFFALLAVIGYFAFFKREGCSQGASPPPFCERRLNWLLGLGFGMALGVKGAPALLLGGCLALHALWWRREFPWRRCHTLILPLAVGAAIAIGCFLPIFWNHASTTVHEMWHDQIGGRMIGRTWGFVYRVPLLLLTLAALHAAWIYPAVRAWAACPESSKVLFGSRATRTSFASMLRACQPTTPWTSFLALTWIVWLIATGATENCTVRYLFPLFPWLAVSLAALIDRCDPVVLKTYAVKLLGVLALAVTVAGLVAGIVIAQLPGNGGSLVFVGLVLGLLGALYVTARRGDAWRQLAACCALGPVALLVLFLGARPLLLPDLGTQARRTWKAAPGLESPVAVLGSPCQASRVRLALAPLGVEAHRAQTPPASAAILLAVADRTFLSPQDYDIYPAARLLDRISWTDLLTALRQGKLASFRESQSTLYCWAIRKQNEAHLQARLAPAAHFMKSKND